MTQRRQLDEQGFVSIMVTMVLIVIITVILLGFASMMQREKDQALDRQLSTQAYYAAETGVNDAINYLRTNPTYVNNTCTTFLPGYNNDLGNGVKYTCLLINPAPGSLRYDSVSKDNPKVAKMQPAAGLISRLEIYWQDAEGSPPSTAFMPYSDNRLPQNGSSDTRFQNTTGMLRVSLTPGGVLGTDAMLAANKTFFLYPRAGGAPGAATFGPADDGRIVQGACTTTTTPKYCRATINVGGQSLMYIQLLSLYRNSSVEVRALDASGTVLGLVGEQVQIDVTGKANDVLRRIQVRRPLHDDFYLPDAAVKTMGSLCKRMAVWPGGLDDQCVPAAAGGVLGASVGGAGAPAPGGGGPVAGGGSGLAGFVTCDPADPSCSAPRTGAPTGPIPGGSYDYNMVLYNDSRPNGFAITGCTWNFGDGRTASNTACNPGDSITHRYSPPAGTTPTPYPSFCWGLKYTVVLTVTFAGAPPSTKTDTIDTPDCQTPEP